MTEEQQEEGNTNDSMRLESSRDERKGRENGKTLEEEDSDASCELYSQGSDGGKEFSEPNLATSGSESKMSCPSMSIFGDSSDRNGWNRVVPLTITFEHLFYSVTTSKGFIKQLKRCRNPFEKEKKYILSDLHGAFYPGEVTAIMGPSEEEGVMAAVLQVAGFVVVPVIGGYLAAKVTGNGKRNWYRNLQKPSFLPPKWLEVSGWVAAYTLMGVSSYLVYLAASRKDARTRGNGSNDGLKWLPLSVYGAQLLVGYTWSYLFYRKKKIGFALAIRALTWAGLSGCAVMFYWERPAATICLLPCIFWYTYQLYLALAFWRLNGGITNKKRRGDWTILSQSE